MNEIERVIEIAKKEVGYLEKISNSQLDEKTANAGNGNYTKYARDLDNISGFYNGKKNGYAWCDIFVDWCFVQAFGVTRALELLCQPLNSCGAGVGFSAQYYKDKGQFYTSPKTGDQVFYKGYNHTGLVIKIDDNYIYTIEGNTSNPVNCVKEKKYPLSSKDIIGYGRPKYEGSTNICEEAENTTEGLKTVKKLYLPATVKTWRVYPMNKKPVVGNECGKLLPSKFNGLEYDILGYTIPNLVAIIQTRDFGKVQIYVGKDTSAIIK